MGKNLQCIFELIKKALIDEDREKIIEAFNLIENEYYLLGCTAIEDELQEKVPEVIKDFIDIGIKVWVLTGDKPDTSISIAISCNLINSNFTIFDFKDLDISNINFLNRMNEILNKIEINNLNKYAFLILTEELSLITSDEELTQKV